MNLSNQTYRLATEDFMLHNPVDDFVAEFTEGISRSRLDELQAVGG